jgi:hypothetical protein
MSNTRARIHALHAWYEKEVMQMRLTPEVERLWWAWFQAGYNGQDLARVIRYIRGQIQIGKRNQGALALTNLLGTDPNGIHRFATDLGLASARYKTDTKPAPLPASEGPATRRPVAADTAAALRPLPGIHLTDEQLAARRKILADLSRDLTADTTPAIE